MSKEREKRDRLRDQRASPFPLYFVTGRALKVLRESSNKVPFNEEGSRKVSRGRRGADRNVEFLSKVYYSAGHRYFSVRSSSTLENKVSRVRTVDQIFRLPRQYRAIDRPA